MAKGYINTVPAGQIGTGAAQVFGVNPVAAQYGNQLAALRQKQEAEAQATAKAWRDNQLAASKGRLWAADMANIEKDFINRGIELQQKGINPYGTSQEALDHQRDQRYVQAQQGYRENVEKQFNEMLKKVQTDASKYDPESIKELNDFFTKTKLGEAFAANQSLPQLRERFDVAKYLQPIKARTKTEERVENGLKTAQTVIDEEATQDLLIGALGKDPGGQKFLSTLTSGVPVQTLRDYTPKYEDNVKMLEARIAGDPVYRKQLALDGLVPDTPQMKEFISDTAEEMAIARKKFDTGMKDLVAASASGIQLKDSQLPYRDPNAMTPYQRESLDIRRQTAAKQGAGGSAESTYRQQLVGGIINNDKSSLDELKSYLPAGSKIDYLTSRPTKESKGGYNLVRIEIPPHYRGGTYVAGTKEDISLSLGDAKNRLNAILNQYSGEKISPSKFNIEGGKPRGKQIEIEGKPRSATPQKPTTYKSKSGITFTVE